ncbi:spore coat protein CotS [Lacrimispora sp.]|uniref:spore coat protein CotS n=1 Tax=Lacrimispora sp. TaxID=2719234 RepID=UPI0032E48513|nr:spore coat protein CotS [Paenibacillaceae bacterium]
MNEKYTEVLSQYELEILDVKRGRGAWLCETDQGLKLLREYKGTIKRLEFEDQVFLQLEETGHLSVDRYVRNKEGEILSSAEDGTRWIVKNWYSDRECNLKDSKEVLCAIERIALLHKMFRKVKFKEEWNLGSILVQQPAEEMERHNRELIRARSFIRSKRKKSEFELCVMGNYDVFFDQAMEACKGLAGFCEECGIGEGYLCHGDLNQHHILMCTHDVAIVEFNRMHRGMQMEDLYHFMRKAMEKHDWNLKLGMSMLDTYSKVLPLSGADRTCLYYLFLYPEKYWKQINFYYNANKAWIPARNIEKLRDLEIQQPMRNLFLSRIK